MIKATTLLSLILKLDSHYVGIQDVINMHSSLIPIVEYLSDATATACRQMKPDESPGWQKEGWVFFLLISNTNFDSKISNFG